MHIMCIYPFVQLLQKNGKVKTMIDQEKRAMGGWWMWILGLVIVTVVVFAALNYAGIIGKTIVERKVFENSYQYSAGQKQKIAIYEAQLAELKGRLASPDLDSGTRANIKAQASQIRIQLAATKRRGQ